MLSARLARILRWIILFHGHVVVLIARKTFGFFAGPATAGRAIVYSLGGEFVGRNPRPTHLKILEGNAGKRPLRTDEPQPAPASLEPPAELAGEALAEWNRLAPELSRLGLLTVVDRPFLIVLCEAWATYRLAREILTRDGVLVAAGRDGGLVKNPAAQVARDQADLMMRYGSRFGLSPSDRVRLAVAPDDGGGTESVAAGILS